MQHRLFINNGKGDFQISGLAFPPNKDNISVAVANDFDNDGSATFFIWNSTTNPGSALFLIDKEGRVGIGGGLRPAPVNGSIYKLFVDAHCSIRLVD